ncbi:UDP-N-acetylmuramoyl-L-alanyl-D-glutamate synthetase [Neoasaia chiangmaiensis NBRC 101099]|uniref:UDP-N-acetylmuramoylalanine--D-glutamate ligase n=1 Tax=Neoasaia chiangmaiensis TaxID=320497 RepID=A0A1U9KST5_9PROT|nr:UDP-N-acetylmuramoyl-L-alanine--D-glutamate ligase [Neoasaia chiangmaiensis]AQS88893.1 UDP-N-acetylmuramoylalanine--D-glutamate ligase [Neoasaia chiangmaiensis]GBR40470.1 UDP-N-acetylmuramoyl-L-alanyl-D-glutamate synthetase [Neoasaia chiangmaiensis NBRC 101099]GEN13884.1 UDP-N-acetylmuramoylalanine--D-glutamate ligase [Neoasaia chiangmaiensis]
MGATFPTDLLAGRHYAVLGLGRNGAAVVTALLQMGASVQAWDDRHAELPAHPRLTVAPFNDLVTADALILSPGIPHQRPRPHPVADMARAAGIPIFSDAELLFQAVRASGSAARFVSITGTNGKSTTTALLAHILSDAGIPNAAGGNLGTASLALPRLPDNGVYVIEMSSYMLERLGSYHASAACLLNLSPDHLDRHGDMAGYIAAKEHVFDHMSSGDLAVIGVDDPDSAALATRTARRGIPVARVSATGQGAEFSSIDGSLIHRGQTIFDMRAVPSLPGSHNAQNALAVWAMAAHLGLDDATISRGLRTYPGLAHRLERVGVLDGITFVNDSKATNAEAAEKALRCYDRVIWIAGGTAKAGGIEMLAPFFDRIAQAFLIGQDATLLGETLARHDIPFENVGTLARAVPAAFQAAKASGVRTVLLSPACASFDQFSSFEARGSQFIHLFGNLIKSDSSPETLT